MLPVRAEDDAVVFDVAVVPRASRERVGPVVEGRLKVAVAAPPVEEQANDALRRVLARALGVPPSAVEVARGASGRRKTVRVRGAAAAVAARLGEGARPAKGSKR